ncbi:uncharacterized protein LOC106668963 [Cimex lectularius]|uniref:F-box domain-containing protein n=1 Tax=Cimex lectularius TaxID=79782 RepID=A0A8I6RWJ1_CIMLE|nr:uncharacterized protein LOC106668963 [Cimex lectularius]
MDIIGNLPIEIAHKIFEYLDATDLCNCCCVSRKWRMYANSNHLWKTICIAKEIVCEPEYEHRVGALEPMVEWGNAYLKYAKRRIINWRNGTKKQILLSSCCKSTICSDGISLIFTNVSGLVFVFDISGMSPDYVQTIELTSRNNLTSLHLAKGVLVIRQGDIFTIYIRQGILFQFKGYMLRHENRYIFAQKFYEPYGHPIALQCCVIDGLIVILARHSLFTCMIKDDVEVTEICLYNRYFFFNDYHRMYMMISDTQIAGFNADLYLEHFDLPAESLIGIKSNKDLVVALICVEHQYSFLAWDTKTGKKKSYNTRRPYGFKVHGRENKFAYVSQEKANSVIKVYLQDVKNNTLQKLDLNIKSIAQAKLYFIGREHLYVAIRLDWEMYCGYYVIDLKSMHVLYKESSKPSTIIHIDTNHAIYSKEGTILIDTFREW